MPSTVNITASGVSPVFPVTAEELEIWKMQAVSRIDIDGVQPPLLGPGGGKSIAHTLMNRWYPWIDEKLVDPKYDGVAQYLGIPSNRPTFIKDYHTIALMRAVDYILAPQYVGMIKARVGTVNPAGA